MANGKQKILAVIHFLHCNIVIIVCENIYSTEIERKGVLKV